MTPETLELCLPGRGGGVEEEEDGKSLLKSTVCVLCRLSSVTWLSWGQHILLDSMESRKGLG